VNKILIALVLSFSVDVACSLASVVDIVTGDFEVVNWGDSIIADCPTPGCTITLPTAVGNNGSRISIRRKGAGLVTADANMNELIDGSPTKTIVSLSDSFVVMSDGANVVVEGEPFPQSLGVTSAPTFAKISTGDIDMSCPDGSCEWTLFEHENGLRLLNKRTGNGFKLLMEEVGWDVCEE
jgi:hypothetical protein